MGKGALYSFFDCNDIKYKIEQSKSAVDKILSHFITALLFFVKKMYNYYIEYSTFFYLLKKLSNIYKKVFARENK